MTRSVPLYRQIYGHFRSQIIAGDIETGALLPTEHEVMETFNVSRITVRRAFNDLQDAGLVTRRQGRGTVVSFDPSLPTVKANFDTLLDSLHQIGLKTEVRLLSVEMVRPDADLTVSMDIQAREKVQRIERLRILDDRPFSYLVTYIPGRIAEKYSDDELKSGSVIALLDRAGHAPQEAAQTISALAASEEVAVALDIKVGDPVLAIHRIMRDDNKMVVQDITVHYRADRFHYHMTLFRGDEVAWSGY